MKTIPLYPEEDKLVANNLVVLGDFGCFLKAIELYHKTYKETLQYPSLVFVQQDHSMTELLFMKGQEEMFEDLCEELGVISGTWIFAETFSQYLSTVPNHEKVLCIGNAEELNSLDILPPKILNVYTILMHDGRPFFSWKRIFLRRLSYAIVFGKYERQNLYEAMRNFKLSLQAKFGFKF